MDEAARQFVATRLRRVAREEAEAGAVVDGKGTVPPPQQVGTAQLAAAVPTSAKLFGVTALLADLRRASGGTAAGDAGAGGRCCFEPSDENSYPPPLAVDHLHDDDLQLLVAGCKYKGTVRWEETGKAQLQLLEVLVCGAAAVRILSAAEEGSAKNVLHELPGGRPGAFAVPWWRQQHPDLRPETLFDRSGNAQSALAAGAHTFTFSLSVPASALPSVPAHLSGGAVSLVYWVVASGRQLTDGRASAFTRVTPVVVWNPDGRSFLPPPALCCTPQRADLTEYVHSASAPGDRICASVRLGSGVLQIGGSIDVVVRIRNETRTRQVTKVSLALVRQVSGRSGAARVRSSCVVCGCDLPGSGCAPGASLRAANAWSPSPPCQLLPLPTVRCAPHLSVKYRLQVDVYYARLPRTATGELRAQQPAPVPEELYFSALLPVLLLP
eukprot:TRINITY_DN2665_c0_g1_i3.p1 TRINITY_DN2665_c0_g1~~TRINITY_DN2665_c0_g1_i3.p1  ORF type:complete len:440 (-),score=112.69 TRINITY_DN2665_c0_g1_i3:29-1348(-)